MMNRTSEATEGTFQGAGGEIPRLCGIREQPGRMSTTVGVSNVTDRTLHLTVGLEDGRVKTQ